MPEVETTYRQAMERLQEIVQEVETGEVDVDRLAASVKEAAGLIRLCRSRLTATQAEIEQALKEMEAPAPQTPVEPKPAPTKAPAQRRVQEPRRQTSATAGRSVPVQPSLAEDEEEDPFANI